MVSYLCSNKILFMRGNHKRNPMFPKRISTTRAPERCVNITLRSVSLIKASRMCCCPATL